MSGLTYRIVTGGAAEQVISLIVTAHVEQGDRAAAERAFANFVCRYKLDVSHQAAAFLGDDLVAGCLFIVNRGVTGTVMLPGEFRTLGGKYRYDDVAVSLLRLVSEQIGTRDLALIQTTADPDDDEKLALYTYAGFRELAELAIMEAEVGPSQGRDSDKALQWVPYRQAQADRFGDVILRTYQDSQDCPDLTGLRTGEEIIEGHRYSGLFYSDGWWLLEADGRDVAVLLLNGTEEDAKRLELVYMGVTADARRRGYGAALLDKAMIVAAAMHKTTIRLAVDTRNPAARRLYESCGFDRVSGQVVMAVLNEQRRERLKQQG